MKPRCLNLICFSLILAILFSFPVSAQDASEEELPFSSRMVESTISYDVNDIDGYDSIAAESEWILLEDMLGTEYAYFIPLLDSNNNIIGYSVVSFLGGTRMLASASGKNAASLANSIIFAADTADKIIYEFPSAFISKINESYYKVCFDGELNKIDNISSYVSTTVDFLTKNEVTPVVTRAPMIYGTLDNWLQGSFVPVTASNGGIYYGGWQSWLTDEGVSKFYADRSCGVTAAANMFHYMSENVSGKSNLYTRSGISKASFSAFQKDVYDYLSPAVWGIPNLTIMIDRVESFASAQGVNLSATRNSGTWNETNVRNYIAGGLNKESPVLLLTWNSPIADLVAHWVTVTRIYDAGMGTKIITSNWAEKETYDFSTWVNGSSMYKGVIYFE